MKRAQQHAFTLIEMIAVLGAIGALAAALLYPVIRRVDHLAREKEANTLAKMAAAYKERVATVRVIPSETGWAAAVAAVTGQQINTVTTTERGVARIFLIDPALRIGTASTYALPYTQTVVGHFYPSTNAPVRPISPRLMIVSSVSTPLPSSLVSGVGLSATAYSFNNIWNAADGTIPGGWVWNGRADDLKIQRIDLSDMFVQVALNNRDNNVIAAAVPSYAISTGTATFPTATVAYGCRFPMYFLKGSEIRLSNVAGTQEYAEILTQSKSFTFEFGTWEPESYIATSVGQPTPMDLQKAFNLFMNSPTNAFANAGASQTTVSNAMMNFLTNYIAWRNNGYPVTGGNKPPAALDAAQTALQNATTDLIDYH